MYTVDALELRIAQILAERASQPGGARITYPMLASEVGWYNPTGQGLGRPLAGVLRFCNENGLPILTSIVCATGQSLPSSKGIAAMRQELRMDLDVAAEQKAVFAHNWSRVEQLQIATRTSPIDYSRLYAKHADQFDPEQCGVLSFDQPTTRDDVLQAIAGGSIFVVVYSSTNDTAADTDILGRVLGIVEIGPSEATNQTHTDRIPGTPSSEAGGSRRDLVGGGAKIRRAWRFLRPPVASSTLVETYMRGPPPTDAIVKLNSREVAEIAQHAAAEVHVFAQDASIPAYIPPEPALNTYMAVCHDSSVLAGTNADTGHLLVKIGISNDKERRLQELNGNHIAVIFGVRFAHYAEGLWPTQSKSMAVERKAHEWCHLNGRHASGEYFYLPKEKLIAAGTIVRTGKI